MKRGLPPEVTPGKRPRSGSHAEGCNGMTRVLPMEATTDDPLGGFNRDEIVLLMLQTLSAMGFKDSQATLERESGCVLERPEVKVLHDAVLAGNFHEAMQTISHLKLEESVESSLKFVLTEQKYMECLDGGRPLDALQCLRTELCPAAVDADLRDRLHEVTAYLMCRDSEDLYERSGFRGDDSRQVVWERCLGLLPSTIVVPPRRLGVIFNKHCGTKSSSACTTTPTPPPMHVDRSLRITSATSLCCPPSALQGWRSTWTAYGMWLCPTMDEP